MPLTIPQYVKENMGAASVKLSAEEVATVRKIAEESDIPGTRYTEAGMQTVLKSTPPLKK